MSKFDKTIKDLDDDLETPEEVFEDINKLKKKKEEDGINVSFFNDGRFLYEQVAPVATHATHSPAVNKNMFIKYDTHEKTTERVFNFTFKNKLYQPINNSLVDKGTVTLPTETEDYKQTSELVKDIKDYLFSYFEPPKFFESLLPYYVLFTWVYDNFPFISYLHFVGLTGTGKTVAAETVSSICYKPVDAAGSVTIASIFRLADQWRGTLFLDEFDLASFGKDGYRAVLTFLKTGVSDRAVLRVEGEKKKEIQSFIVKSPKIFTSESPITDAGLQSRTFVIKMEKNRKKLPLFKLKNYYDKAKSLRNKLLLWRLHNLGNIDLNNIEFGFEELSKFDRRVQQIITPIYYISDDETKKDILKFAKQQEEETFRERRESLEGKVFELISENSNRKITLSEISEAVSKGSKYPITERKLSNVIRKILGFEIERQGHDNLSSLIIDYDRLESLREYYGLPAGVSVASVASDAQAQKSDTLTQESENSQVSDEVIQEIFGT